MCCLSFLDFQLIKDCHCKFTRWRTCCKKQEEKIKELYKLESNIDDDITRLITEVNTLKTELRSFKRQSNDYRWSERQIS